MPTPEHKNPPLLLESWHSEKLVGQKVRRAGAVAQKLESDYMFLSTIEDFEKALATLRGDRGIEEMIDRLKTEEVELESLLERAWSEPSAINWFILNGARECYQMNLEALEQMQRHLSRQEQWMKRKLMELSK